MKRLCGLFTLSIAAAVLLAFSFANAQETKKAETPKAPGLLQVMKLVEKPELMVQTWLLGQIDECQKDWEARYETVKTLDDVAQYQKERIDYFWKQLGALWEKSPLNPKVTGTLVKDGYRVEKIVFETLPNFYATGTMFLPLESKFKAPYPGMLVVCGHSATGKGADWMQRVCALGATNGLAVFIMDPIDQGERFQILKPDGNYEIASVAAHNVVGSGSILLGRNAATFEVWDMVRALDYLQSRKDVIGDKLGVAGISGGGTQTSYIMSLDERVWAAAPSCYLCNIFDDLTHNIGPQDAEQNIFGQAGFGMDHADYCIMRAPRPTLILAATKDFFFIEDTWKSYRFANRMYTRFGFPERMSMLEKDDKHHYSKEHREGTVRWMLRWLAGRDEAIVEAETMPVLTLEEIASLPKPGVLGLSGARTTYDLNRDLARELTPKRKAAWAKMTPKAATDLIRQVAGINKLVELRDVQLYELEGKSDEFVLGTEGGGIFLPVRANIQKNAKDLTIFVDDQGRHSQGANAQFAKKDQCTVAVELRGWGESQAIGRKYYKYEYFGTDGSDYYLAYLLGRSYVEMRTEDLLAVSKYFKEKLNVSIHLVADGYARTVALHAAIAEPQLFASVEIRNPETIQTWNSLVEKSPCPIQLTDTIHGVLNYYDLDDLLKFVKNTLKK